MKLLSREDIDSMVNSLSWGRRISRIERGIFSEDIVDYTIKSMVIDKYYENIIIIIMNNSVLQIPMSKELRINSEKMAKDSGFSSLQEVVRLFLTKFSKKEMEVSFEMPKIKLSAKNDRRYTKMIEDYEKNKDKYITYDNVDELMKSLNS